MDEKIWTDFVHAKFGDEYLCLYISRQRRFRKWFKIITIFMTGSGILTTLQDYEAFTIASLIVIAIVQGATLIENELIDSEDRLEDLTKLRMLYFERTNDLEQLFLSFEKIGEEAATEKFFELRKSAKGLEELDTKLDVDKKASLIDKASTATKIYIKSYHNG